MLRDGGSDGLHWTLLPLLCVFLLLGPRGIVVFVVFAWAYKRDP
jgi:hypothetical protein